MSTFYRNFLPGQCANIFNSISGRKIHLAFVPADPRLMEHQFDGMNYFLEHTDADYVFPMHMWKQYEVQDRLIGMEVSEPYREKIMRIREMGQVFEL